MHHFHHPVHIKPTKDDVHSHTAARSTCSLFLQETEEVDALGALNRHAQGAVPDELDQRSEGATDTEGDGIVQGLLEAIVVKEDTGGGVDVRVGVLGLECC